MITFQNIILHNLNKSCNRFYSTSSFDASALKTLADIYNSDIAVKEKPATINVPVKKTKIDKYYFVNLIGQANIPFDTFISLFDNLNRDIRNMSDHHIYKYHIYIVLPVRPVIYKAKKFEQALNFFTDAHNAHTTHAVQFYSFPNGAKLKSHLQFIDLILTKWRTTINFTDDESKLRQNIISKIETSWDNICKPNIMSTITVNKHIQFKKLQFIDSKLLLSEHSSFIGISQSELINLAKEAKTDYDQRRLNNKAVQSDKPEKLKTPDHITPLSQPQ